MFDEESYRMILTSLFHNRTDKVTLTSINQAMSNVDLDLMFPVFYKRMEHYFKECDNSMIDLIRGENGYPSFIKFLYDAIGQSIKYCRKFYQGKRGQILLNGFRNLITDFFKRNETLTETHIIEYFETANMDFETLQRIEKMNSVDLQ